MGSWVYVYSSLSPPQVVRSSRWFNIELQSVGEKSGLDIDVTVSRIKRDMEFMGPHEVTKARRYRWVPQCSNMSKLAMRVTEQRCLWGQVESWEEVQWTRMCGHFENIFARIISYCLKTSQY